MKHRLQDYTDQDLLEAASSEYNSISREYEIAVEIRRRRHQAAQVLAELQPISMQL
jgi:hypothetical protein